MQQELQTVVGFLKSLQDEICQALSDIDSGVEFREDVWEHERGGGGRSRVLEDGLVFEKAGVNFSQVRGDNLPASATADRSHILGKAFEATGVSLVIHPLNPFVPTTHMNVRFFIADPESENPVWWFGGGYDLTPYYPFVEDCRHWHRTAKVTCDRFDIGYYPRFKKWCDEYFYLKHRDETRGIGGLFFDDFCDGGFENAFEFLQSVGTSFIDAYVPIVERRKNLPWDEDHQAFQHYRRGRYVEFNLVYDRGTVFGLQSGGRTESILMSMPPRAIWKYDWCPSEGSKEADLYENFLGARDWV